jgi:hypothetical protein
MANPKVTVLFYGAGGTVVAREHTYATRKAAFAAMDRARKRGQISAIKGTRKAGDPPTVHH